MGIAVVTGANSGIGLATTIRLARDGHEVYAAMRDLDRAGDLREACIAADVDRVSLLRIDVTDDRSVALAFEQVRKQSGPVDVLVNNAGISTSRSIEETDIDTFSALVDVNYLGAVRCTKAVIPAMRELGRGHIVNVTSIAGRVCQPTMGAYAGSKWALEGFSEVLAQELAPFGVAVVVVEPGVVATPIFTKGEPPPADSPYQRFYARGRAYWRTMLRQPSTPEEVAEVIAGAVSVTAPAFRLVVGSDAERRLAGRLAMADEDLIAMASLDDDAWYVAYADRFGIDLR